MIDQAIFTSCRSREGDGYRLAAQSPGVTSEEARELTLWSPTHDAFGRSAVEPLPVSINFHRLESGRACLSCTRAAGEEYSGRRGARIYTQLFLADEPALLRFAGNPWRLWEAVSATGQVQVREELHEALPAISLVGGCRPVDRWQLHRAVSRLGVSRLVELLDGLFHGDSLALAGVEVRLAMEGLLNLLPPERRGQISFSTALVWSAARRFRLMAAPADAAARRQFERLSGMRVIDCERRETPHRPESAWAVEVSDLLEANRETELLRRVARPADELACGSL